MRASSVAIAQSAIAGRSKSTVLSGLRFLPGGLEYRPTGLLLPGDPVSVPYEYVHVRTEGDHMVFTKSGVIRPASPASAISICLVADRNSHSQKSTTTPTLTSRPKSFYVAPEAGICDCMRECASSLTNG